MLGRSLHRYLKKSLRSSAACSSAQAISSRCAETAEPHSRTVGGISVARHQAFVDRIAPAARNIHAYWLARRAPQARLRQLRKAADPGRNDLCPCGSGKKFKRCHGATDTLH
jgi:uncharacterized protein YecA (UPF0149 family)